MKRLFKRLPYLGLLLLLLALLIRAFRTEGLALPEFPTPPRVELPSKILGVASERLSGRVVDARTEPISEALVMVDVDGELIWDYCDQRGQFELPELPAGVWDLTVLARKYTTRRFKAVCPGDDLVIDLGEPVAAPPRLAAIGESDLQGEVIASIAGRGLLGYEVQLVPLATPDVFGTPIPVRTDVGADRTFTFRALLHGEYRVIVLPPWAKAGSWPNLVAPQSARFTHGPAVRRAEFRLRAGEIGGRVIDSRGEFVHGALILVEPARDSTRPWPPVQSNETGGFLVQHLPPGHYRLRVFSGQAAVEDVVEVLAGVTSEVDLAPLSLRARQPQAGE